MSPSGKFDFIYGDNMAEDGYRVLIVDDEKEIVQGMVSSLKALTDFKYEAFDDPGRALQAFWEKPFHLILTDVSMPRIDGFELMKRIKEKRPASDFILITAHKSVEVVTRARRLGAAFIFYKPVDLEEIINAMEILYKRYLYWQERFSEVS